MSSYTFSIFISRICKPNSEQWVTQKVWNKTKKKIMSSWKIWKKKISRGAAVWGRELHKHSPTNVNTSSHQTALPASHQEAARTLTTGWKQIFNPAQIWARFTKMFLAKEGESLSLCKEEPLVYSLLYFLYLALREGSREGRGGCMVATDTTFIPAGDLCCKS